ncbi:unnamed protein product [Rhizoctonia solani]|uniref:Uncharacterized protein n=1 Tax=Rhizoctonia solani TaxID=456999 RepID=A0A8H3DSZ9_9AGAM|nr:unnamed protein product [Rhizoctonia solani]
MVRALRFRVCFRDHLPSSSSAYINHRSVARIFGNEPPSVQTCSRRNGLPIGDRECPNGWSLRAHGRCLSSTWVVCQLQYPYLGLVPSAPSTIECAALHLRQCSFTPRRSPRLTGPAPDHGRMVTPLASCKLRLPFRAFIRALSTAIRSRPPNNYQIHHCFMSSTFVNLCG